MYKQLMFALSLSFFSVFSLNACRPYWFYYGEQRQEETKKKPSRPATPPQYPGHGFVPHVGPSTPATK